MRFNYSLINFFNNMNIITMKHSLSQDISRKKLKIQVLKEFFFRLKISDTIFKRPSRNRKNKKICVNLKENMLTIKSGLTSTLIGLRLILIQEKRYFTREYFYIMLQGVHIPKLLCFPFKLGMLKKQRRQYFICMRQQ